jgi:cell division transport system ATP-binding protein
MIQLFHVSKTYVPNYRALTDINLEITRGEFVFVAGASGAGKSTLLKLLFREEEPSEGQILIDGSNLARLNRRGVAKLRRKIGLVFQECKLLAGLTALQNVALAAEVVGVPKSASRIKAYQLLHELGLKERYDAKALSLSAGEQQRVAIARALMNEPKLLLADDRPAISMAKWRMRLCACCCACTTGARRSSLRHTTSGSSIVTALGCFRCSAVF